MTGLLGGAFDPPHYGHVSLARDARARLGLSELVVLVVADPGHKRVHCPVEARLALARAAFPGERIEVDGHARTVDMLRERRYEEPLLLIGADEFRDFPTWKEPNAVLELAKLAVASRPGYHRRALESVLAALDRPERVLFFEIEPVDVSSSEVRERIARGERIDGLVPVAVAKEIERRGLYREAAG